MSNMSISQYEIFLAFYVEIFYICRKEKYSFDEILT